MTTATQTYDLVTYPADAEAYRTSGQYHAANRENGRYRTLCGKVMYGDDFVCFADEKHVVTCKRCRKALA